MAVSDDLVSALKRVIPTSSLPLNYPDHERLADELVLELSGTVVMLDKREYDLYLRRLRQIERAEEAITKGL